jgi:hypothetical protein
MAAVPSYSIKQTLLNKALSTRSSKVTCDSALGNLTTPASNVQHLRSEMLSLSLTHTPRRHPGNMHSKSVQQGSQPASPKRGHPEIEPQKATGVKHASHLGTKSSDICFLFPVLTPAACLASWAQERGQGQHARRRSRPRSGSS